MMTITKMMMTNTPMMVPMIPLFTMPPLLCADECWPQPDTRLRSVGPDPSKC